MHSDERHHPYDITSKCPGEALELNPGKPNDRAEINFNPAMPRPAATARVSDLSE
jgi:hypothetical protein